MMPKKMIAKNSIAAVGARSPIPSLIMSLILRPAPAKRPKASWLMPSAWPISQKARALRLVGYDEEDEEALDVRPD